MRAGDGMIEQQKQKEPVLCCRGTECSRSLAPSLPRSALRPQGCFDISEPLPSIRSSGVQAGWIQRYVRINCGVSHPSVKGGLVKSCICIFLHCGVVVSSVCLSDLCIVVVCLFFYCPVHPAWACVCHFSFKFNLF